MHAWVGGYDVVQRHGTAGEMDRGRNGPKIRPSQKYAVGGGAGGIEAGLRKQRRCQRTCIGCVVKA